MQLSHLRFTALAFAALAASAAEPTPAPATDTPPELRGVLIVGSDRRFALCESNSARTDWVTIGESFNGWKLTEFRPADETLALKKGAKEIAIRLAASQVGHAEVKATVADAEDVFRKMNFDVMLDKILSQQKESSLTMVKRMAASAGGRGAQSAEVAELQKKVMDVMFAEMTTESLRGDFARIYSEVFTKDELRSMGDFYGTPLGQTMIAKQPEMQQKISEVMQTRVMAAMPKIQQVSEEFRQQQQAKRQAQQQAAPAPAVPPQP